MKILYYFNFKGHYSLEQIHQAEKNDLIFSKAPIKQGKCPKSCFADGSHRCGLIRVCSICDNGIAGDSAKWVCLECGKIMKENNEVMNGFIPLNQPNTVFKD